MKTAIKLASIGLITTSIAQSAQDPRFLGGNANPSNGLGQSMLLDPTIGDKILEDDIARTSKLSLLEEVERIEKLSLKEYEDRLIEETKIKSEKIAHKNDLSEMEELLLNITLADSIEEEKRKKQIEEDELFALQNNFGGNLEQSFYGDDFLLAMQLSLQDNSAEKPIEVKAPEIPDIMIEGILDSAGKFLAELRDNLIKTDYPHYFQLLKDFTDETLTLEQMETMQNINEMQITIKKIDIATLETKIKENEILLSGQIQAKYDAINKVKALMEKFNINEKNAKEIIDFCL